MWPELTNSSTVHTGCVSKYTYWGSSKVCCTEVLVQLIQTVFTCLILMCTVTVHTKK